MSQGRKDLLPGEVPDRLLWVPTIDHLGRRRVKSGVVPKRSPALTADDARVAIATGPPDLPDAGDHPTRQFENLTRVPAKSLSHVTTIYEDDGVWCWSCVACSEGGEGTKPQANAAAASHRASS